MATKWIEIVVALYLRYSRFKLKMVGLKFDIGKRLSFGWKRSIIRTKNTKLAFALDCGITLLSLLEIGIESG